MKTFIVLSLDTRRAKADGTYPILLRIIHHEKTSSITLGVYITEKDWDAKKRCIKSSYKGTQSVTRLNNFLQKKKSDAIDLVTKLDERKTLDTYTVLQLKELIEKKPNSESFIAYAETLIAQLKESNRFGNARAYESALIAFKKFHGKKDLSFYDLNLDFLERFERHHLSKGNTYNGIAHYFREIRAIYNKAIKANVVDKELYPFANFEIKTTETRKRAIKIEAIQRIENCILEPNHPLFHTRNYWLLCFYFRGINFADLADFKVSDKIENRIHYERNKTHKNFDIRIYPEAQKILDIYLVGKKKDEYIFPIIKSEMPEQQYKDVQWARNRFNKKLKKLAALCKIEEDLTSYVARHSFATRAKNQGIATASISEMLGHKNISTTQVYLDSLQSDLLDEMHEKIIS